MAKHCISINDIPPQGRHLMVDDQEVWAAPLEEFHMQCQIVDAIQASVELTPIPGGVMVRGTLVGSVELPCNRCAEPMRVAIETSIDRFEGSPDMALGYADDDDDDFNEADEILSHVRIENATPVLDLAALCWEEFMLAFPLRPICSTDCKGLCAVCGTNLNEEKCLCTQDGGDARLAVLRTVKIKSIE